MAEEQEPNIDWSLLRDKYTIAANYRMSGDSSYHNLTLTYLTAHSILIAATILILRADMIVSDVAAILFSVIGGIMVIQMAIAQSRYSAQNYYWERTLRIIEQNDQSEGPQLFRDLHRHRKDGEVLPKAGDEPAMCPNFGTKYHQEWWAPRMKGLPVFIGLLYVILVVWAIARLVAQISGI